MINYDLSKIKAIIFDIDGVLSAETITMNAEGEPLRTVNIKDGYAIQLAVKMGLHIAILTGAATPSVALRYQKLGVTDVFLSCAVKVETYERFLAAYGLTDEEVLYVGDDIPDYEACPEIKSVSRYVATAKGGYGVGREILEQVLRVQGHWMSSAKAFGW